MELTKNLIALLNIIEKYNIKDIKIKGALDSSYEITGMDTLPDGTLLLVSNNLVSELEDALGADL